MDGPACSLSGGVEKTNLMGALTPQVSVCDSVAHLCGCKLEEMVSSMAASSRSTGLSWALGAGAQTMQQGISQIFQEGGCGEQLAALGMGRGSTYSPTVPRTAYWEIPAGQGPLSMHRDKVTKTSHSHRCRMHTEAG
jgi:hypothetical protein